jgi:hypothetical protein
MFVKVSLKKPYMFRSLFYDHLQGSSFVLSAFTTFRLPAGLLRFSVLMNVNVEVCFEISAGVGFK